MLFCNKNAISKTVLKRKKIYGFFFLSHDTFVKKVPLKNVQLPNIASFTKWGAKIVVNDSKTIALWYVASLMCIVTRNKSFKNF